MTRFPSLSASKADWNSKAVWLLANSSETKVKLRLRRFPEVKLLWKCKFSSDGKKARVLQPSSLDPFYSNFPWHVPGTWIAPAQGQGTVGKTLSITVAEWRVEVNAIHGGCGRRHRGVCVSACQQGKVCAHSSATGGASLLPLGWSHPTPPWWHPWGLRKGGNILYFHLNICSTFLSYDRSFMV